MKSARTRHLTSKIARVKSAKLISRVSISPGRTATRRSHPFGRPQLTHTAQRCLPQPFPQIRPGIVPMERTEGGGRVPLPRAGPRGDSPIRAQRRAIQKRIQPHFLPPLASVPIHARSLGLSQDRTLNYRSMKS